MELQQWCQGRNTAGDYTEIHLQPGRLVSGGRWLESHVRELLTPPTEPDLITPLQQR